MEFVNAELENGLQVVAECNRHARSAALGFFVNTGARDETDEESGVSHFLEHMTFKGTPRRSADDVNRELDEMGAEGNAFTTEEVTVYHLALLPEFLDRGLDLLSDILRPSLRAADFEMEKQVVLEEIHMNEDLPPFGADDKCRALYFAGHPLGRSVLGTLQSVGQLTPEAMRAYHQRRYVPGNMVLAATGRVDFDALVASARRYCGHWQPAAVERPILPPTPRSGFHVLTKEGATQQYAIQLTAGPSVADPRRYAARLLTMVLGDDSGSRLFWELLDPGLADHAGMYYAEYDGAGMFATSMSCDPEAVEKNLQAILDVFRDVEEFGVTEPELAQAKNKAASQLVLGSERPAGRLFRVGGEWLQRREHRSLREDLDLIAALGPDNLMSVLERFPLSQSTTIVVGPLDKVERPG